MNTHGSGSMGWFERRVFLKEITQKDVIYRRNCEKENGLSTTMFYKLLHLHLRLLSLHETWHERFIMTPLLLHPFFSSQSQASTKKKKKPSSCKVIETPHGLIWWRIWEEGDEVGQSHEEKEETPVASVRPRVDVLMYDVISTLKTVFLVLKRFLDVIVSRLSAEFDHILTFSCSWSLHWTVLYHHLDLSSLLSPGIGYASIVIVSLLNIYYIVILAWGLYYLFQVGFLERKVPSLSFSFPLTSFVNDLHFRAASGFPSGQCDFWFLALF